MPTAPLIVKASVETTTVQSRRYAEKAKRRARRERNLLRKRRSR